MAEKPTYKELEKRIKESEKEIEKCRQRELSLIANTHQINQFLAIAGVIFLALDDRGNITLINEPGLETLGYRREELLGKNWFKTCVPSRMQNDVIDVYQQLMKGEIEPVEYYENPIMKKNGEERIIAWHNTTLKDAKGKTTGVLSSGEDISERINTESHLREAYEIINRSPVVTFLWEKREGWPVEFVSENVKNLFGYSATDFVIGKINYAKVIHPDDLERVAEEIANFNAEKQDDFSHEPYRIVTKDRDIKWVDDHTFVRRDIKGKITHYQGVVSDITQRKIVEKTLWESEERYRSLFKNSKAIMLLIDPENADIVDANPAAISFYGWSYEELIGKKITDINTNTEEQVFQDMEQSNREERGFFYFRHCLASGETRDVEVYSGPITVDNKKLLYSIIHDISDRKLAEKALGKSEALLKKTGQVAKIGGWELDAETLEVIWTEGIYRIYQIPLSQKPPIEEAIKHFHPDDRPRLKSAIQKALDYGEPYDMEIRFITAKGKHLWTHTICKPVVVDGKTIKLTGIFQDITDRKQAEEEKRKALEFAAEQSKNALIGQVAGKMAHDFNNVLMAIMGNAQLAIRYCNDEKIKDKLYRINEFSERGRDITNDLMSFAKDQTPKQTYFKIEDKMELVLKIFEKDLTGIKVNRNYESGIPELLADPGMIQDVLVNLLQNSLHAMSKVANPTLKLEAYSQDDTVCWVIEDNGCGIPKKHQDSIYTPSFTLKGSRDETGSYESGIKGAGYGMANVKKYIIEKHKGVISLESEVGKGTKFTIALKIIKGHLSSDEKKEVVKSQIYSKRRLLLVEDETAIADVQYQILTEKPFSHIVSAAVNGQMAIDIYDGSKFDAVSLDYMLPGKINGMDVYNHIRKNDTVIPVLIVSGNIEFLESMKELKKQDPNLDHLSKPVNNLEYVNKINELIGKSIK